MTSETTNAQMIDDVDEPDHAQHEGQPAKEPRQPSGFYDDPKREHWTRPKRCKHGFMLPPAGSGRDSFLCPQLGCPGSRPLTERDIEALLELDELKNDLLNLIDRLDDVDEKLRKQLAKWLRSRELIPPADET